MKINGILIYKLLLGFILLGQILGRILDLNEEINTIFDMALFFLIGFTYLVMAWAFDKFFLKSLFLACGIYLIIMNFLDDLGFKFFAFICVLIPLIIGKFLPEEVADGERVEH